MVSQFGKFSRTLPICRLFMCYSDLAGLSMKTITTRRRDMSNVNFEARTMVALAHSLLPLI
jgi:hypothetical protein